MAELLLIAAARKGQLDKVRQLIADGCDVDEHAPPLSEEQMKGAKWILNEAGVDIAAEAMGQAIDVTPLMVAAEEGHEAVVEALLSAGADVNAQDSFRRTAMMIAITWKHEAVALRLLVAGADPNAKDASGDPVLTQAINAKLWRLAHALLDAGALAQPKGKKGCMPLSAASSKGGEAEAVIVRLLDAGAKPSGPSFLANIVACQSAALIRRVVHDFPTLAADAPHDGVLEAAGKRRDLPVIEALLESGIRPTNKPDQVSPLAGVIMGPARSVVDFYLPEHINDAREVACLERLLAAGADINHATWNPLHFAIYFCRSGLCRWLLDHGADPNFNDYGRTLIEYARKQLEEHEPSDRYDGDERAALVRRQNELRTMIMMLGDASGSAVEPPTAKRGVEEPASPVRKPSRLQNQINIAETPVAKRRGVCADGFSKAEQIMIRADIDKIADMLAKDRKFERVERGVFSRLRDIEPPLGGVMALVKLKGHDWVHVAGGRRSRGDSPMKAWSKALKAPVLYAGEQSTAGVVYYWLYDRGECAETFESDGVWFHGGVEIDPEVQDEADRMVGTTFTSLRRKPESIDWSAYESEYDFLDRFLREEDAYLTFMWAGPGGEGKPLELSAYHEDEVTTAAIERVDLAFYKATPQQVRAASQPNPEEDALLQAIKANDESAAQAAIDAGAEVNGQPPGYDASYLRIAVGHAVFNRDLKIIDILLDAGANPNNGGDEPVLCSVSLWAIERVESMRIIQRLLGGGADVNSRERRKNNVFMAGEKTPLMLAAQSARLNYVKALLKHGADASLKDEAGRTALDAAANWLREVKKDRLKDVPSFTDETYEPVAEATVELLEAAMDGTLDIASLPTFEELLAAETERVK